MVELATAPLTSSLQDFWLEIYPEDAAYLPVFFSRYFTPERAAVIQGAEGLESVLYNLPMTFRVQEGTLPFLLLYAGGTLPPYRRRGHYAALLRFYQDLCQARGYRGFVLCARPEAGRICEALGITEKLWHYRTSVQPRRAESAEVWRPCGLAAFQRLRGHYVDAAAGSFFWETPELEFVYQDLLYSGEVLWAELDGMPCYAVVDARAARCIREAGCPPALLDRVVDGVCGHYGCRAPMPLLTREALCQESRPQYAAHVYLAPGPLLSLSGAYCNLVAN